MLSRGSTRRRLTRGGRELRRARRSCSPRKQASGLVRPSLFARLCLRPIASAPVGAGAACDRLGANARSACAFVRHRSQSLACAIAWMQAPRAGRARSRSLLHCRRSGSLDQVPASEDRHQSRRMTWCFCIDGCAGISTLATRPLVCAAAGPRRDVHRTRARRHRPVRSLPRAVVSKAQLLTPAAASSGGMSPRSASAAATSPAGEFPWSEAPGLGDRRLPQSTIWGSRVASPQHARTRRQGGVSASARRRMLLGELEARRGVTTAEVDDPFVAKGVVGLEASDGSLRLKPSARTIPTLPRKRSSGSGRRRSHP
jgi:hypothetical protein